MTKLPGSIYMFLIFILTLSAVKIFSKCGCTDCYTSAVEAEVNILDKKLNYFFIRTGNFELSIYRKNTLIQKWDCMYDDFGNYVKCAEGKKSDYSKYRFYRWIDNLRKKAIDMAREFKETSEHICCEIKLSDLDKKRNWIQLQEQRINDPNILTCLINLKKQISLLEIEFEHVLKIICEFEQTVDQFRTKIEDKLNGFCFDSCYRCSWL